MTGKATSSKRSSDIKRQLSHSGFDVFKPSTVDLTVFDYNFCRQ